MIAKRVFPAALAALGVLVSLAAGAQAALVTVRGIHPEMPRPFEMVNLRLSVEVVCGMTPPAAIPVEFVSGEIRVRIEPGNPTLCPVLPLARYLDMEVRLGAFPVGTYHVDVAPGPGATRLNVVTPQRLAFQVVASPQIQISPPPPAPYTDFSGHWWNADESGWGLSITQSASNQMFVVLYLYDTSGAPGWYVVPGGTWTDPLQWGGTLYRTSGPPLGTFLGGAFDPDAVVRTPVGTASFSVWYLHAFANPTFGEMDVTLQIDGVTTRRTIRRMAF